MFGRNIVGVLIRVSVFKNLAEELHHRDTEISQRHREKTQSRNHRNIEAFDLGLNFHYCCRLEISDHFVSQRW